MSGHYTIAVLEAGWWIVRVYRDGRWCGTYMSQVSAEDAERMARGSVVDA